MGLDIVVYSAAGVRARIIGRTLAESRRRAAVFESFPAFRQELRTRIPDVLIYEGHGAPAHEWKFVRSYAASHPETEIFFLVDPAQGAELAAAGLAGRTLPDELLDPEAIRVYLEEKLPLIEIARAETPAKRTVLRSRGWFRSAGIWVLRRIPLAAALLLGGGLGYFIWAVSSLPRIDQLAEYAPFQASRVYSSDHLLLASYYLQRRTYLPTDRIPQKVKEAFLAAEDKDFYRHLGIDPRRILAALSRNIREGEVVQGGSTITQQLAKMLFLKPEKSLQRKIKEMALAFKIERRYTKDEILGLYLNQTYFGTRAYGIEAAAETYFGKTTEELSLAQAALLAALPKAPSLYSPFRNPERCRERRNYVLDRMVANKVISAAERDAARAEPIPDEVFRAPERKAPYFLEYCRTVLESGFGNRLQTAGLDVITTLDSRLQDQAERAVAAGIQELRDRGMDGLQGALVAEELGTGRILAMVGGLDFAVSQFNRATQARRQTGSAFKPFVYLTALESGYGPDDAIVYQRLKTAPAATEGRPGPSDASTADPPQLETIAVSLRAALAYSMNGPTQILAQQVGLRNVIATAHRAGVVSDVRPFISSALGASEATLLEMVNAYATLATSVRREPACIDSIVDPSRSGIWTPGTEGQSVISASACSGIRSLLRSVCVDGTAAATRVLGRPGFGKTGTTNDSADAWFIGFDERLVVGVWIGRDRGGAIGPNEAGATVALPIWIEFMRNSVRP